MRSRVTELIALFIAGAILGFSAPATAERPEANFRLLIHGTKQLPESAWGISGWVLAPNVVRAPTKWLAVAGPRYRGHGFWVEVNTGAILQDGGFTPLFDLRASLTHFAPVTAWTNWQWMDYLEGRDGVAYGYLQLDYVLPGKLAAVGLETENFFRRNGNDLAAGPHAIFLFERLALVVAYQFHNASKDQLWVRMVVNP